MSISVQQYQYQQQGSNQQSSIHPLSSFNSCYCSKSRSDLLQVYSYTTLVSDLLKNTPDYESLISNDALTSLITILNEIISRLQIIINEAVIDCSDERLTQLFLNANDDVSKLTRFYKTSINSSNKSYDSNQVPIVKMPINLMMQSPPKSTQSIINKEKNASQSSESKSNTNTNTNNIVNEEKSTSSPASKQINLPTNIAAPTNQLNNSSINQSSSTTNGNAIDSSTEKKSSAKNESKDNSSNSSSAESSDTDEEIAEFDEHKQNEPNQSLSTNPSSKSTASIDNQTKDKSVTDEFDPLAK